MSYSIFFHCPGCGKMYTEQDVKKFPNMQVLLVDDWLYRVECQDCGCSLELSLKSTPINSGADYWKNQEKENMHVRINADVRKFLAEA